MAGKEKRSRYPLRYTLLKSSRYINTLHGAKPYIYGKRRTIIHNARCRCQQKLFCFSTKYVTHYKDGDFI